MKRLVYCLCIFFLFSFKDNSPEIKIYEKEEKIEKLQRKGFAVLILLEKPFVDKLWSKKVKDFGKVENRQNEYIINEAVIPQVSPQPVRVYSKVTEKSKLGVEVWMCVDLGTEFITASHPKSEQLEQVLYQFAIDTYKADYALQVEEAEKNLSKINKEYERTVATEQRIKNRIEKNKEDKKALIEKLKNVKTDSLQLVKDLEMNILEQKQDSLETIKAKKSVDAVKQKMAEIK